MISSAELGVLDRRQVRRLRIVLYALVTYALFATLFLIAAAEAATTKVVMIAETYETHLQWQEEMKAKFEETHPGISIELIGTAGPGLVGKMQTMLAAGLPLDIGHMDPWLVVQWASDGTLENLSPYIQKSGTQFADWYPSSFDLYRLDSGIYGLPQDLQITGIFYNEDAFHEAGLAPPGAEWNLDDFLSVARRLTQRAGDGSVLRYGFRLAGGRNFLPTIWALGGELFDSWIQPTRFIGNTEQVAAGFEYMHNLVRLGVVPDRQAHSSLGMDGPFRAGQLAMAQTNSIVIGQWSDISAFKWDVAPLPKGPAGRIPFINSIGWFMFSSSKNKDAAWEVLRFFNTQDAWRRRVEIVGNIPPSRKVIQSAWIPSLQVPEHRQHLLLDVEKARSPWPIHNEIWAPVNNHGMAAIWGDIPVKSALETMEAQVNAIIKDRFQRK